MNEHLVGVTLLFFMREDQVLKGILKSYVLSSDSIEEVRIEANLIGEKQNVFDSRKNEYSFKYLGIEDIFKVIGPVEHGAMLGRMTIWDQTIEEARKLVLDSSQFAMHSQLDSFSGKWYLATPAYFVNTHDPEELRSISCLCLIESQDPSSVIEKATCVSTSHEFKSKIVEAECEGLELDELFFLGFEDIKAESDDIQNGGAFLQLYKEIDSIEEIEDLLADEDEISGFFTVDQE